MKVSVKQYVFLFMLFIILGIIIYYNNIIIVLSFSFTLPVFSLSIFIILSIHLNTQYYSQPSVFLLPVIEFWTKIHTVM